MISTVWIFVISTLFLQEPASTGAAVLVVREYGLNVGLVNFIWVIANSIDISAGYGLGLLMQKWMPESRFVRWAERHAADAEKKLGRRGTDIAGILLGFINVPYINGFIFAWFKPSFQRSFALIIIGNGLYWAGAWLLAIGVRSLIEDWRIALLAVIVLGLLLSIAIKAWFERQSRKR